MSRTNDSRYRRNRARILRGDPVCHLCGEPIDRTLTWPHPQSASADHLDPVSRGGDNQGELAPAHLGCNSRRGNDTGQGRTRRRSDRRPPEPHPGLL